MAIQSLTPQLSKPEPDYSCVTCEKLLIKELVNKCSRCSKVIYCGRDCQTKHWPEHKKVCNSLSSAKTPKIHFHSIENESLRSILSNPSKKRLPPHIIRTRECILEGSKNLDPEKSIVTVFGAQFFGNEFLEPLPELLKKCKQMILVDIDFKTLSRLKLMRNDPKC